MQNLYVLLPYSSDWEDIVIILTEIEAIKASIKYPVWKSSGKRERDTYLHIIIRQLIKNM